MKKISATVHFDLDYMSNGTISIIDSNNEVTGTIINLPIHLEKN